MMFGLDSAYRVWDEDLLIPLLGANIRDTRGTSRLFIQHAGF